MPDDDDNLSDLFAPFDPVVETGTVRSRLFNARKRLKDHLGGGV